MNSGELISCIVPVYNGERFVSEALDSIFAQTYRPIEVIVVDDGSTDGTPEILARYGERIQRFRQDNLGPAAARNRGIEMARGKYVAFLDADDVWHKNKLERQMQRFTENPELEVCITYKENFWESERRSEETRLKQQDHPFIKEHPGFVCQTLLACRSVFDRVGTFNESIRIGEDTDWYARAGELGVTKEVLPEVLVYRRMHSNNLTLKATKEDRLSVVVEKFKRLRASSRDEGEMITTSSEKATDKPFN